MLLSIMSASAFLDAFSYVKNASKAMPLGNLVLRDSVGEG